MFEFGFRCSGTQHLFCNRTKSLNELQAAESSTRKVHRSAVPGRFLGRGLALQLGWDRGIENSRLGLDPGGLRAEPLWKGEVTFGGIWGLE